MAQVPSSTPPSAPRDLMEIVAEVGLYPVEAYEFVQSGLPYTVEKLRGDDTRSVASSVLASEVETDAEAAASALEEADAGAEDSRHITGQEFALGLRDFAWAHWGRLARTVLARWNITSTMDFGRIVYALIDAGVLSRTPTDRITDFRNVYDFKTLETDYVLAVGSRSVKKPTESGAKLPGVSAGPDLMTDHEARDQDQGDVKGPLDPGAPPKAT